MCTLVNKCDFDFDKMNCVNCSVGVSNAVLIEGTEKDCWKAEKELKVIEEERGVIKRKKDEDEKVGGE
jgi:hypothetical protein